MFSRKKDWRIKKICNCVLRKWIILNLMTPDVYAETTWQSLEPQVEQLPHTLFILSQWTNLIPVQNIITFSSLWKSIMCYMENNTVQWCNITDNVWPACCYNMPTEEVIIAKHTHGMCVHAVIVVQQLMVLQIITWTTDVYLFSSPILIFLCVYVTPRWSLFMLFTQSRLRRSPDKSIRYIY